MSKCVAAAAITFGAPVEVMGAITITEVPDWVGSLSIQSDDGYAQLEWTIEPTAQVDYFRLDENSDGTWRSSYVLGTSQNLFRGVPNTYQFRLSACIRNVANEPECGAQSNILQMTVTDAILDPYRVEELPPLPPTPPPSGPPGDGSGGPGDLAPGRWYYPDPIDPASNPSPKPGQGWSFYWNNTINEDPIDGYDLFAVWYTFEAKTFLCETGAAIGKGGAGGQSGGCINGPETQYRHFKPVVITGRLTRLNEHAYEGNLYHYVNNAQCSGPGCNIGTVSVVFSPEEDEAKVTWQMAFIGTLERIDSGGSEPYNIGLLTGDDGPGDSDGTVPTDLAGLWNPNGTWDPAPGNTGNWPIYAAGLGTFSESAEIVFFDEAGVLTWIFGYSPIPPTDPNLPGDEPRYFCYKYLDSGYKPETYYPTSFVESWWYGGDDALCVDVDQSGNFIVSEQNSNGSRQFTDFRDANVWVDFELPPTDPAIDPSDPYTGPVGGSVAYGTKTNPASLSKFAKLHEIRIEGPGSCFLNATTLQACWTNLTWFSDGNFPNATIYARAPNHHPYVFEILANEPGPIENFNAFAQPISLPGEYYFELRKGHSTDPVLAQNSRLIARSGPFVVAGSGAPYPPGDLVISEVNPPITTQYRLDWSHPAESPVGAYIVEETDPGGEVEELVVENPVKPFTIFDKSSGPYGIYSYKVKACSPHHPVHTVCSNFTGPQTWEVLSPPVNDPPYFPSGVIPPSMANTAFVEFQTEVADPNSGDTLLCGIGQGEELPAGLFLTTVNNDTCLISGLVNEVVGSHGFTLTVADDAPDPLSAAIPVVLNVDNSPPFFSEASVQIEFPRNASHSKSIAIGDVDPGQNLDCDEVSGNIPVGLMVSDNDSDSCIISGSTAVVEGTYPVTLSLSDNAGGNDSLTIEINVTESPLPFCFE